MYPTAIPTTTAYYANGGMHAGCIKRLAQQVTWLMFFLSLHHTLIFLASMNQILYGVFRWKIWGIQHFSSVYGIIATVCGIVKSAPTGCGMTSSECGNYRLPPVITGRPKRELRSRVGQRRGGINLPTDVKLSGSTGSLSQRKCMTAERMWEYGNTCEYWRSVLELERHRLHRCGHATDAMIDS